MSGFGVFLAIATAFSWALGCVVHTTASRVVGIPAVMLIRQPLASVVLGIFCLVMGDLWLPSLHLFWLAAASGVFGIIIGDACQYAGALTIGLRPAQVCQSLSSCFTALFGSIYLNEYIGLQGWLGMFVATCGVILVVLSEQRDAHNPPVSSKQRNKGVIISLLAAVFVALGIVFSKLGCLFGPAGGIWLSCVALDYLPAAVAAMLIGLQPIALLIITGIMERRIPAPNSIIGSIIACTGAAILLLR